MKLTPQEKVHLDFLTNKLRNHNKVKEMKNYIQHGTISTYEHCKRVTELSFLLNRRLHLNADEKALVTGAFLHDFYLYDWHNKDGGSHDWHGFIHAARAKKNAKHYFNISKKEADIIERHMWPLNLTKVPNSKEGWIVTMADKYISAKETLFERKKGKKHVGK